MKRWLIASAATIPGVIILAAYAVPPSFPGYAALHSVQGWLLSWAITLSALAGVLAVLSLVRLHWNKLLRPSPDPALLFGVAGLLGSFGLGAYVQGNPSQAALFTATVGAVLAPIEGALLGLLAVTLVYSAMRLLRRRRGILVWAFMGGAGFFLLLFSGWLEPIRSVAPLGGLLNLAEKLPSAGARGLLIGLAGGAMLAGLRVLIGEPQLTPPESRQDG